MRNTQVNAVNELKNPVIIACIGWRKLLDLNNTGYWEMVLIIQKRFENHENQSWFIGKTAENLRCVWKVNTSQP